MLVKPLLLSGNQSLVHNVTHSPVGGHLLRLLERLDKYRPDQFRVLTYHRVDAQPAFEQQMAYLAENYCVISVSELLAAYRGGRRLRPRSVLITFDDAYRNFAELAWPVLRRHRLPVTLFVPTAFPDNPEQLFWWDRLRHALTATPRRDQIETPSGSMLLATAAQRRRAYKRLRAIIETLPHTEAVAWTYRLCAELGASEPEHEVLSWDELRRLAAEGVTLGAHTQTHPLLSRVSPQQARDEALGSLIDLRREIGRVLPIFAYPSGQFNDQVVDSLRTAGFLLAFTTVRGTNDLHRSDQLRLRRNNIGEQATLPVLRARLLHASPYLNRLRPLLND